MELWLTGLRLENGEPPFTRHRCAHRCGSRPTGRRRRWNGN